MLKKSTMFTSCQNTRVSLMGAAMLHRECWVNKHSWWLEVSHLSNENPFFRENSTLRPCYDTVDTGNVCLYSGKCIC